MLEIANWRRLKAKNLFINSNWIYEKANLHFLNVYIFSESGAQAPGLQPGSAILCLPMMPLVV